MSGLVTRHAAAATARILDAMLAARIPFLLSPDLVAEYHAVFARPRIRARHRRSDAELDRLLRALVENAAWRELPTLGAQGVRRDAHLWALRASEPDAIVVTGDGGVLDAAPRRAALSPRAYAALLPG